MSRISLGEILLEEYLIPNNLSISNLVKELNISNTYLKQVINNEKELSLELAIKLSKYFNTTIQYWLNMKDNLRNTSPNDIIYNYDKFHNFPRNVYLLNGYTIHDTDYGEGISFQSGSQLDDLIERSKEDILILAYINNKWISL